MAAEALELHVAGMTEDGDPIPQPSAFDAVMADAAKREAVAFLLDIADRPSRAVRINVMLPENLVLAIDRTTTNRSRFLSDAARSKLRETA